MWTSEELGLVGAEQYIRNHAAENGNMQFVMESDFGTFAPMGLEVSGNEMVQGVLQRIISRLVLLLQITSLQHFSLHFHSICICYCNLKIHILFSSHYLYF